MRYKNKHIYLGADKLVRMASNILFIGIKRTCLIRRSISNAFSIDLFHFYDLVVIARMEGFCFWPSRCHKVLLFL